VDLLVCEGTYGDDADAGKAVERGHMTFAEAAALAAAGRALRARYAPERMCAAYEALLSA
jgi:hypothetical protein